MNRIKLILLSLILLSLSGCCMGYKRYFKRVDAISMELRDTQRDLSVIGKKSLEIDSNISSEHEGVSATFLKIDSIGEDISVIRERMGDILKALDATKKPCNKDLKQYHQGLKNLVEIISENPNYMVFDDDLIKIVFENEIKTITLEKLKEYEANSPHGFKPNLKLIDLQRKWNI